MSFKYSVIGYNTIENREHLEKIGAKLAEGMSIDYKYLYVYVAFSGEYCYYSHNDRQPPRHVINCIGNPQLFKAVSAITDDNDEDQWFTDGKEWIFCDRQDWIDMYSVLCSGGRYNYNKNGELDKFHKATLSELQAHFQRV